MKAKIKRCKCCKKPFNPINTIQPVCLNLKCIVWNLNISKNKQRRKELKEGREKLKSLSVHLSETQAIVNRYRRLINIGMPCMSCQKIPKRVYSGHFKSVGGFPELRFTEINIWNQCFSCNFRKGGNILQYRENLIIEIGIEKVNWLEGPHTPVKYSVSEAKAIKRKYKDKIKLIKY